MSMNKDLLSKVLIFIGGAAIGSVLTWKFVKEKYEREKNEDIEAMREDYREAKEKLKDEEMLANIPDEYFEDQADVEAKKEYKRMTSMYEGSHGDDIETEEVIRMRKANGPRVISPSEFEDLVDEGYSTETLYYYEDGVLTDDYDNVIEDVEEMVSEEALKHFGDYEDDKDTVYVRNDNHHCLYEILRDTANFSDKYPEEYE